MERAKQEVKKDMRTEMNERDEQSANQKKKYQIKGRKKTKKKCAT